MDQQDAKRAARALVIADADRTKDDQTAAHFRMTQIMDICEHSVGEVEAWTVVEAREDGDPPDGAEFGAHELLLLDQGGVYGVREAHGEDSRAQMALLRFLPLARFASVRVIDSRIGQMHGTRRKRRWFFVDEHDNAAFVVREEMWVDGGDDVEAGDPTVFAVALAHKIGWTFP